MKRKTPSALTPYQEKVNRIRAAGLHTRYFRGWALGISPPQERLQRLVEYLDMHQTKNPQQMLFLIMYDIEDHKIRRHIAKYLIKKGCMRMQKSIYIGSVRDAVFQEISEALREINQMYQNNDSIVLLPVTPAVMQQINVLGKNIDFRMYIKPPTVLII